MPVKVSCPSCSKELNAPDELVGQLVACPRCNKRFHVKLPTAASAIGSSGQAAPTHASAEDLLPPTKVPDSPPAEPPASANLDRISLGGMKSPSPPPGDAGMLPPSTAAPPSDSGMLPPSSVPPTAQAAPTAQPVARPRVADSSQAVASPLPPSASAPVAAPPVGEAPPAESPPPAAARFKGVPSAEAASGALATPRPERKKREVKKARFVASGAVSSRINLGEDGKLPELVVADAKQAEETPEEAEESGSPLLMVAVLIFSVLVSIIMLTLPDDSEVRQSTSKQAAIEHIETHYIGKGQDFDSLKPYQQLLRDGLQAHRLGDVEKERDSFHRVLAMLRAESRRGVTTEFKRAELVPNDRDLEVHLNILLADD